MKEYRLDGAAVNGIDDLYEEFDRMFMAGEDWRLGPSLDGLHDVLFRVGQQPVRLVWTDHAHSREALGAAGTERWLRAKLERPDVFDVSLVRRQLEDLRAGTGKTYFDLVLEVLAGHPRITLDLR